MSAAPPAKPASRQHSWLPSCPWRRCPIFVVSSSRRRVCIWYSTRRFESPPAAARSDINTVRVLREEFDLSVELAAVVATLTEGDRSRVRLPATGLTVQGDRLRVRQIIRNLVSNALRHGGPTVWVEFDTTPETGRLTVVDNGPGIPNDAIELLFEPYFHGLGDTAQPASMGLGLTVSRFLAHLMDGDLSLVSHPGGTAFQLALPRA